MPFNTLLQKTGLVAILRGVKPDEIVAIGEKLYAAGFRLIDCFWHRAKSFMRE